jgi:septal ring-binding cell division protein DamX
VSATETPPNDAAAPSEPPVEPRRCPRCGATLREDQEWCLGCGTGVGAHVAPPRGWRVPLAVVAALLALALVAVALAIVELARGPEQITTAPTPTPPAVAPTAVPSAAPPSVPTPSPSATPTTAGGTTGPTASAWPPGKSGWTVLLDSSATLSAALARARDLSSQGIKVKVMDSTGYHRFSANRFAVILGDYATRAQAAHALKAVKSQVAGASVGHVRPG